MFDLASTVLAVDPVPWARSQMAFTLGVHIILVPLGVSWAAMALIANYRGDQARRRRRAAARAAVVEVHGGHVRGGRGHRHRAHLRVRAAVAEVHGPVGRRVRHPVRVRGPLLLHRGDLHRDLHLRLEAAEAVAALLDRGPARDHRHRRQRLGRRRELVDERAGGLHAELGRQGRRRRPGRRDLQQGDAATRPRTWWSPRTSSAASSSRRSTRWGCSAAGATATTGSGSSSRSPSPRSPRRSRWPWATRWPAGSTTTSRRSSPRSSWSRRPTSDVPETLFGHLNSTGTKVEGGIPIPGLASILSDPADGTSTVVQGRNAFPASTQPTVAQANVVHLAWDVMVGLGTLLFLLSLWYGADVAVPTRPAEDQVVPAHRGGRRRPVGHHDGGRLGGHRGRPPTVDRLRPDEGGGGGDRQHRRLAHVRRRRRPLRRSSGSRRSSCCAA